MIASAVVPTIGRPTLARAVASVLSQESSGEFEVIVVNDSGEPLPPAEWHEDPRVSIIHTLRRERCVARNAGAAIARGRYLHFLDDDDWLLPGALAAMANLADGTGGAWLYGNSQLVDRQGNALIELHHHISGNCAAQAMSGEWIPLQSSWIDASLFFAMGGFNPAVPGAEDIDLIRRLSLRSDIAGTEALVACIVMGEQGSTTDYAGSRITLRQARERVLDTPGVRPRLLESAATPYLRGRIARVYATSALWNLGQGRVFDAAGRAFHGAGTSLARGSGLFSAEFWRGFVRAYQNETFARGFAAAATT